MTCGLQPEGPSTVAPGPTHRPEDDVAPSSESASRKLSCKINKYAEVHNRVRITTPSDLRTPLNASRALRPQIGDLGPIAWFQLAFLGFCRPASEGARPCFATKGPSVQIRSPPPHVAPGQSRFPPVPDLGLRRAQATGRPHEPPGRRPDRGTGPLSSWGRGREPLDVGLRRRVGSAVASLATKHHA